MSTVSENNKRIAKNTLFLYFRMLLSMGVSLYTSRVVLSTLGVEDFGIYGVVGGIVAMFSFINSSMSGTTSRFLTFELGRNDKANLKKTFSSALTIHFSIALLILILAETVGLWFLENKLVITEERMLAARWVYQLSIMSTMISITQVPYNATIIAHERMNVYAYVEILNVLLKLGIVYLLVIGNFDKLILYAILTLFISTIIAFVYRGYCLRYFEESRYKFEWNKENIYPMLSFSAWDMFGLFAGVLRDQGLNILLNMFFGPVVNAARTIAVQVQGAIGSCVSNFQIAVIPQLVKNYATGNVKQMISLAFNSSKLSFLLLAILATPLIIENSFVLNLWLKNVPEYASVFCQIVLLQSLLSSMITPLAFCVHATGKIKLMNVMNGMLYTSILPISYLFFRLGFSPVYGFFTNLGLSIIGFFVWLFVLKRNVSYSIKNFFSKVVFVCVFIFFISIIIPIYIHFNMDSGWIRFFIVLFSSGIFIVCFFYLFAIDKIMKKKILVIIKKKLSFFNKKNHD